MVSNVFESQEFKEEETVLMVFMVIKSNSDWASLDSKWFSDYSFSLFGSETIAYFRAKVAIETFRPLAEWSSDLGRRCF